ncbi:hypothetical protein GDO78_009869 [Eleutherodactylus coqui]|uniref:HEAT repeat-containing protein 1 n=1 Tax=Eleutherodactylus coqui TaxID=57060 RepID=A0A8J6K809_ELECQ|nr:hypothetical protein GDO78_009869 [Eleutherodactylus coqui]
MTSLAQQLKRLALPQTDPSLFGLRQVASLLFDHKEAATIDRDTFYALGCTGLEELIGIDDSFAIFEETLFSSTSKTMERSVQTKAVNEQLDESISLFLTHLSPYFMLKPAQKCMEWLIQRFHIHLYNQDLLIGCVLPYHETKVFVRVIQLLKIEDPTHKWNWLHPIQKPGVPLARSTLITHCCKDMGFMEFICSLVTKALKVFSEESENEAKLRVLISFYVSTIVAALETAESISHMFVAKLLPYVQKGLKSSLVDYKAATYMIVCQLAVKTIMEPRLVKALASQLSRRLLRTPSLVREGVAAMIILLQSQQSKDVGKKPFLHLCKVPELVSVLQKISSSYDASPLLEYLLPNLVRSIVPSSTEPQADDPDPEMFKKHLEAILINIPLQKDLDKLLARTFLEEFLTYGEQHQADDDKMSELRQSFLPLIRLLEKKYPEALDSVLERQLKEVKDQDKQELFHQFIALSTSGGKHELLADCGTSFLLSLNHPQAAVRHLALLHLKNIIEKSKAGFEESFIKEAILARLKDENVEVLMSALESFEVYLSHFTAEEMVSVLLALFDRADLSQDDGWYKAIEKATELLVQDSSIKDHPELCNRVVMAVIPHMVFTNNVVSSAESNMAVYLGRSGVCHLHPLLKGWSEALNGSLEKAKAGNCAVAVNYRFSELLSGNMAAMDSSTFLKMVEDVLHVADKDTVLVRQKVTFHVLSQALVAGCLSCQDPELQVATKIFQLLDKKLRSALELVQAKADKWVLDKSSGEQLYKIVLTKYIVRLNAGESVDMVEAILLMLMVKTFMNNLKCPESFPKGETWWNPVAMDSLSKNYLQLLVGMFDVIVIGASDGAHVENCRALLGFLFSDHLKGPIKLFSFLCLLWTYGYNLSSPLGCTVNAMLQTRAFYIGQALLTSPFDPIKKEFELMSSPVAVSLVINLANPIREVRRGAIVCLSALNVVKKSLLYPVIQTVSERIEEIVADPNYVAQALGSMFEQAQTSSKASQKLSALKELLSLLQNPSCPTYVGNVLLKVLHSVNGENLLIQLLPVLKRLLEKVTQSVSDVLPEEAVLLHLMLAKFNEHTAGLLSKDPQCLDIFIQALKTPQVISDGMPSFQMSALGQITKAFFSALDGTVQQKLLGVLFDLLVESKNSTCVHAVSSTFKSISVNAVHISTELEPAGRDRTVSSVRQARRTKMQAQRKQADKVEEGSVNWSRSTLILELLQHKKKLKEPQHLVPTLFYLLLRSLEPSNPEQGNVEYTKQLILSCLLNICQKVSLDNEKDAKEILDEEKFNVELIVQCIRTSEMPQTHHHALLLLGAAAGIFPDKVLHNIMPIFTFMGASVMRLDDSYSFQVISKTVQTVIPALMQVTRLDKIAVKIGPASQLSARVTALKTTLATKLSARVLLPAVTKCYCHLVDAQQENCIGSLMDILREHIAAMDKLQLSSHQSELTTFFLKALDYRAEHTESDLEEVGQIEGHVINCFIIMVMKLSEATFRPLFFKLFDWSKTEESSKDRLLTFCRLADCIADKLKGLFTLFAGHLVKPFAEILVQTNAMKTDEAFFESDENNRKSCLLLEFVLNCLHKIFLYDTQHFVSKERAEALMMPLVDQIENLLGGDEKYQMRVSQNLVPCIAQFSVAMADDSLWKPLNYQILLKMRHSSPKVRFAALLVLVNLVEKLRENYMVLLPEAIPFLAELMEDECEEVEQQCQKTIRQLEIILGESLQSYF